MATTSRHEPGQAQPAPAPALTETQIYDLLAKLYKSGPNDEYALLRHVRSATGASQQIRTADALAVSLWPSRGITFSGFEFKSARSDFQREMADPSKADEIARYCHYWWIVTGRENIALAGELPMTWGLIVPSPTGDKLIKAKHARELAPNPPSHEFVASILRNVASQQRDVIPRSEIQAKITDAYNSGERNADARWTHATERKAQELDALKKSLRDFEKASGIRIEGWNGGELGQALQTLIAIRSGAGSQRAGLGRALEEVRRIERALTSIVDAIGKIASGKEEGADGLPSSSD